MIPNPSKTVVSPSIFKAYDIRGVVGETLRDEDVHLIGRAFATKARRKGHTDVVIGRDGRISGPHLADALARGLCASGMNVIDLGMVATPMVYFAAETLGTGCGIMVTGSHNPPQYNGLKMVLSGEALHGDGVLGLYQAILEEDFDEGLGKLSNHDIADAYIERIAGDIKLAAPLKIAVDCGNGIAGAFARRLYEKIGCEVTELFCEVDGNFPNHHPDPADPDNLKDLIDAVATGEAEVGLAFDGDGDRLGIVTKTGNIVFPDRQLILFARDVLSRQPGATIIFDVKCTRALTPAIRAAGGQALMWKTGHSLVKAKLRETGAALAGEMSGHMFFKERWYGFDDGLYAGARMVEILAGKKSRGEAPSAVLDNLPNSFSTPELQIKLEEGENVELIDRLQRTASSTFEPLGAKEIHFIDGVRIDYADGFGLARSSNTTPVIVLRFEGETQAALSRIQADFRAALRALDANIALPF